MEPWLVQMKTLVLYFWRRVTSVCKTEDMDRDRDDQLFWLRMLEPHQYLCLPFLFMSQ